MAHFAKVVNGKVTEVIVAEPEFFDTFVGTSPGQWIQTSINTHNGVHALGGTPLRYNFAGVGYTYDPIRDAFITPQPYPSWVLNQETLSWAAPVAHPQDGKEYYWNEATQTWAEIITQDGE